MSEITRKAVKKALMGATLLATSPAWAKGAGQGDAAGGKSQIGVNHLSLDETPGANATVCSSPDEVNGKSGSNFTANNLNIAIDPFASSYIEIVFSVRDILAQDRDHFLFLATSSGTMPVGSPAFQTPRSLNELRLRTSDLEILAMYDIPAQTMLVQDPTRLGMANPAPHSTVSFSVNLDTGVLPRYIDSFEKTYVQAALISKDDYGAGKLDRMILSELDTIGFVKYECPAGDNSVGVSEEGVLVATEGGEVIKSANTGSSDPGAVCKGDCP